MSYNRTLKEERLCQKSKKEFKNLLTKEQYEAIAGDYQSVFTKDVTQTNSYYDYEGLLQQNKMALRIRIVEGKETGEITLKIPQSSLEVLEYTEVLPVDILNAYNHDKQFALPTSLQETLENKRHYTSNCESNGASYNASIGRCPFRK